MEKQIIIGGWTYDMYVSQGVGIVAKITSPKGNKAECCYLGIDTRLEEGVDANINWTSCTLNLTDAGVGRLIKALNEFIDFLDIEEPDHMFVRN
mgnify:FL=1